jgi:hypothetical protein
VVAPHTAAPAFNQAAEGFARIEQQVVLAAQPRQAPLADVADAQKRLEDTATQIDRYVKQIVKTNIAGYQVLADAFTEIAAGMRKEAEKIGQDGQFDAAHVLREHGAAVTMDPVSLDDLPAANAMKAKKTVKAMQVLNVSLVGQSLVLFDVPTDDEYTDATKSGHPVAAPDGRLWPLCRERLLGNATVLAIRAVDTGNAIEQVGGAWVALGECDREVDLPGWIK